MVVLIDIGRVALILAFILSVIQWLFPLIGMVTGVRQLTLPARASAVGTALFSILAWVLLGISMEGSLDALPMLSFSEKFEYVLSRFSESAVTWRTNEGALFLLTVAFCGWSAILAFNSRRLSEAIFGRIWVVLGVIGTALWLFILFHADPFSVPIQRVSDGLAVTAEPTKVSGLLLHLPFLYFGYMGFAVPFAGAIAALLVRQLDTACARWMRSWTAVAWLVLTAGIFLGSYWSYSKLGWENWWFWDPVDNASLMPWLTATALLHSLAVTEKRGYFRLWTIFLSILTFSLCLLGTLLVHPGALSSVGGLFAGAEGKTGLFLLPAGVIGVAFIIFVRRAPSMRTGVRFGMISRESMLLVNNIFLLVSMGAVLLGTLYPLLLNALGGGKVTVGTSFFDAVLGPLMLPLVCLIGLGPLTKWSNDEPMLLFKRLVGCLLLAIVCGSAVPLLMGEFKHWVLIGMSVAFFVMLSVLLSIREEMKRVKGRTLRKIISLSRSDCGMYLAHLGVAVLIVGITMFKGYQIEREVSIYPGDAVTVGQYTVRFVGTRDGREGDHTVVRGEFQLQKNGSELTKLYPETRIANRLDSLEETVPAVYHGWSGDVSVALVMPTGHQGWRIQVNSSPFMRWIWGGILLVTLGGLLAALGRRYYLGEQEGVSLTEVTNGMITTLKRQREIHDNMDSDEER